MLSDSVRVLLISGSTRNGSANSAALAPCMNARFAGQYFSFTMAASITCIR